MNVLRSHTEAACLAIIIFLLYIDIDAHINKENKEKCALNNTRPLHQSWLSTFHSHHPHIFPLATMWPLEFLRSALLILQKSWHLFGWIQLLDKTDTDVILSNHKNFWDLRKYWQSSAILLSSPEVSESYTPYLPNCWNITPQVNYIALSGMVAINLMRSIPPR